jgi:hypothetical protein
MTAENGTRPIDYWERAAKRMSKVTLELALKYWLATLRLAYRRVEFLEKELETR